MKSLPRINALVPTGLCALVLGCGQGQSPSDGTVATTRTSSSETTTTGSAPIAPSPEFLLDGRADNQTAVAIAGGTLAVTPDGAYAVATDPDRDRIFLVELASHTVTEVAVPAGAELGRVIAGPPPLIYALGRRSGTLYSVDPTSPTPASVTREVHVCAAPRGLAFDSATGKVHVACHSGKLLTLDALTLSPERELWLDVDLRDVLVTGKQLLVSRFRSAEVLLLDEHGEIVSRLEPDPFPGCARATALYRMASSTDQVLYLSYQVSGLDELGTHSGGYGNSCSSSSVMPVTTALPLQDLAGWEGAPTDPGIPAEATRSGISHTMYDLDLTTQAALEPGAITPVIDPTKVALGLAAGVPFRTMEHRNASGPFDLAVSAQGDVAQLLTGNAWNGTHANLWRGGLGAAETSENTETTWTTQHWEGGMRLRAFGEPVAVAFTPAGQLIVQSREPAALQLEDGSVVELSQESHANTGHAMFHMTTGVGISCASCHPEGSEDGHTWAFPQGLRRTQPLNGGVLQRAPFHWNGELASIEALVADVLLNRMGMQELVSVDQANALASWLDSIPNVPVEPSTDPEAVNRGEALFEDADVGCTRCHTGPAYADNRAYDVGTGMLLFTPTLLGVGTRQPLMHDGCAPTLEARFGLCGGEGDQHGAISHLDEAQKADLVEFLRTL